MIFKINDDGVPVSRSVHTDSNGGDSLVECRKGDLGPIRDFSPMGGEKEKIFRSLWQEYRVRPGLSVSVLDASLDEDFSFDYRKENRFIDFGFALEGVFTNEMNETPLGSVEAKNQAGKGGVGFFQHVAGRVSIPAKKKVRMVHMHVLPEVLETMLGNDVGVVPAGLRNVLENKERADFFDQRCMSPKIQAVANQLFFGIFNNCSMKLCVEGKALELLGLSLMGNECERGGVASSLCARERDVIYAIRKQIQDCYAAPPTLEELARTHHIGVHKIQAGFRSLFGMSVFAFLKEYKLQKARMLFEEGDMNVSEVAWSIGYINLSHFSAAYRKRFGVLPKAYLKSIQSKAGGMVTGIS